MRILLEDCSRRVLAFAVCQGAGAGPSAIPAASTRRRRQEVHFRTGTAGSCSTLVLTPPRGGLAHAGIGTGGDEDMVVILGATGTGKSKLSIDLGTRYPAEVVNSDKMQVYRGLDITTNKLPMGDRGGVRHHLLGDLDPDEGVLTPGGFRLLASGTISDIRSRGRLPVVAGGSNSFVHALLAAEHEDGRGDPFGAPPQREHRQCVGVDRPWPLRYRCCLLWVDVGWGVLEEYLNRRVDEMVTMGMVDELARHFDRHRAEAGQYTGLEAAIGVPEFDEFFLRYSPRAGMRYDGTAAASDWRAGEREAYEDALDAVKLNTRVLARRQVGKIERMRGGMGWEMRRLDATETVARKLERGRRQRCDVQESWERDVLGPAMAETGAFLDGWRRRSWVARRRGVGVGEAAAVDVGKEKEGGDVALVVGQAHQL